eukprot:scaffold7363_cov263-Pinguiococcus_pyrenoidosus.AAC.18
MADVSDDAEAFHIVLFYRYVRLAEVDAVAQQLQDAMDSAEGLSGRILLAEEGVNGNLAAPEAPMQHFLAQLLDVSVAPLSDGVVSLDEDPDGRRRRSKRWAWRKAISSRPGRRVTRTPFPISAFDA